MSDTTPLMKQYFQIKAAHAGAILFFRMGDFYEMFGEDAEEAAGILGIALTTRDKGKEDPMPMCGIPYHSAETYLAKLIRAGRSVAICEQVEDPREAKGIVRREVVRTVTPGTHMDAGAIGDATNRFIVAVFPRDTLFGIAAADLSTGTFVVAETTALGDELNRFNPGEVLVPSSAAGSGRLAGELRDRVVTARDDAVFEFGRARTVLVEHFGKEALSAAGCDGMLLGISAAGALVAYLKETQQSDLSHMGALSTLARNDILLMDAATQRNLELVRNLHDGGQSGTLVAVMDRTLTPMGGRLLRSWILAPLRPVAAVVRRHDVVESLVEAPEFLDRLRDALKGVLDMERLVSRIMMERGVPRDLGALRTSLGKLPEIRSLLERAEAEALRESGLRVDPAEALRGRLEREIVDEPPLAQKEGGIFRDGVHPELDELRMLSSSGRDVLASIEARERERTGIPRLKVGYNRVFGYFLEVSNVFRDQVPADYVRKQTLVNSERYITEELKEYENKILGADEKIKALEHELFLGIRSAVAEEGKRLLETSAAVARLDVLAGFAVLARERRYTRPRVNESDGIFIKDGRHPVVEAISTEERFTPNDTSLDTDSRRLWIITGPNMAGKSTYMRQVALITIMAQMGSFVPAAEVEIGVVDRVFTRIGASDRLSRGLSTFMVEMTETANILAHATSRSLILLDEIGRGTSTFDGVSIAWAVAEYLHDHTRARTLFATHYHELAEIALVRDGVRNANVAVKEWGDRIIFLRKIGEGTSDKSYGIQVARLAGLPQSVLDRAREILANLEEQELNEAGAPKMAETQSPMPVPTPQLDLFGGHRTEPIVREVLSLDLDGMTPIEALTYLSELKRRLR